MTTGQNVTIFGLATTPTAPVANDRFVMWQTTASQTVQVTATQIAGGVYATPVVLTGQVTATTVGAAGLSPALPSTPLGYLDLTINGVACKMPFYNV